MKGKPPKASFPWCYQVPPVQNSFLTPMCNKLSYLAGRSYHLCHSPVSDNKGGCTDCRRPLLQCWCDLRAAMQDLPAYLSPLLSGQGVQQNFEVDKGSPTFPLFPGPPCSFRYPVRSESLLSFSSPNKALAPEYHSKMQNNKT